MTGLDLFAARKNMITNQVRAWDVDDARVLELLALAPREDYVPAAFRNLAYADLEIPLGYNQKMFAPKIEARFLQALKLQAADKVLEIGTGSGYMTALLAALSSQVVSVEIVPQLANQARTSLDRQGIKNARVEDGDGALGWEKHAPYDVIMVTGSMEVMADEIVQMLNPGGRLGAVVGVSPAMNALILNKTEAGIETEILFETEIAPLINARKKEHFVF